MIQYTTGTINQPDAGSVGLAMVEKFRDDLSATAAWDLVEEFTAASGTVRWYVFKCLATSSGLPADFYVVVGRTLATGELRFAICEGYNAAGHTMSKFAPQNSNVIYDADGSNPNTYVLAANPFPGGQNTPKYWNWTPSGTSTKWWIVADVDRFVVAFNGAANGFVMGGAFTPLTSLTWNPPIMMIGSSDDNGGATRNPGIAGLNLTSSYSAALAIMGGGGSNLGVGPALGFQGPWQYNDKLQTNQRAVAEQGIIMSTNNFPADYAQVLGYVVGKQKGMRVSNMAMPSGFAFGDAFALNGTLWVPSDPAKGRIWDTGVASS